MILSRVEYQGFEIFKIRLRVEYDEKPKVFFYFQETLVKARTLSFIRKMVSDFVQDFVRKGNLGACSCDKEL